MENKNEAIKIDKKEEDSRNRETFTIEKFNNLNLNETNKYWYIFFRNYIQPQVNYFFNFLIFLFFYFIF
jgi:hypothetical protein